MVLTALFFFAPAGLSSGEIIVWISFLIIGFYSSLNNFETITMPKNEKRHLAAIMFADFLGYTALMSQNEKRALEILEINRSTLQNLLARYNGRWLKEIGDGTHSSFCSSIDAVLCAQEFQRAMAIDFWVWFFEVPAANVNGSGLGSEIRRKSKFLLAEANPF